MPSHYKHTEETKKKISETNKGKIPWNKGVTDWMSKEHRETIKKTLNGKTPWNKGVTDWMSEKQRENIKEANRNRVLSHEQRTHLSTVHKGQKGKPCSVETRKKISEANKKVGGLTWLGRKHSEKTKRKQSDIKKGALHPMWKGGISYLPYCHKFNTKLKEQIRERDNRTCQLCKKKENGRRLSVHHVHYDKENCAPDLISLCHECNTKVNHNRDHYEQLFINKLHERGIIQ